MSNMRCHMLYEEEVNFREEELFRGGLKVPHKFAVRNLFKRMPHITTRQKRTPSSDSVSGIEDQYYIIPDDQSESEVAAPVVVNPPPPSAAAYPSSAASAERSQSRSIVDRLAPPPPAAGVAYRPDSRNTNRVHFADELPEARRRPSHSRSPSEAHEQPAFLAAPAAPVVVSPSPPPTAAYPSSASAERPPSRPIENRPSPPSHLPSHSESKAAAPSAHEESAFIAEPAAPVEVWPPPPAAAYSSPSPVACLTPPDARGRIDPARRRPSPSPSRSRSRSSAHEGSPRPAVVMHATCDEHGVHCRREYVGDRNAGSGDGGGGDKRASISGHRMSSCREQIRLSVESICRADECPCEGKQRRMRRNSAASAHAFEEIHYRWTPSVANPPRMSGPVARDAEDYVAHAELRGSGCSHECTHHRRVVSADPSLISHLPAPADEFDMDVLYRPSLDRPHQVLPPRHDYSSKPATTKPSKQEKNLWKKLGDKLFGKSRPKTEPPRPTRYSARMPSGHHNARHGVQPKRARTPSPPMVVYEDEYHGVQPKRARTPSPPMMVHEDECHRRLYADGSRAQRRRALSAAPPSRRGNRHVGREDARMPTLHEASWPRGCSNAPPPVHHGHFPNHEELTLLDSQTTELLHFTQVESLFSSSSQGEFLPSTQTLSSQSSHGVFLPSTSPRDDDPPSFPPPAPGVTLRSPPDATPRSPPGVTPRSPPGVTPQSPPGVTPRSPPGVTPQSQPAGDTPRSPPPSVTPQGPSIVSAHGEASNSKRLHASTKMPACGNSRRRTLSASASDTGMQPRLQLNDYSVFHSTISTTRSIATSLNFGNVLNSITGFPPPPPPPPEVTLKPKRRDNLASMKLKGSATANKSEEPDAAEDSPILQLGQSTLHMTETTKHSVSFTPHFVHEVLPMLKELPKDVPLAEVRVVPGGSGRRPRVTQKEEAYASARTTIAPNYQEPRARPSSSFENGRRPRVVAYEQRSDTERFLDDLFRVTHEQNYWRNRRFT